MTPDADRDQQPTVPEATGTTSAGTMHEAYAIIAEIGTKYSCFSEGGTEEFKRLQAEAIEAAQSRVERDLPDAPDPSGEETPGTAGPVAVDDDHAALTPSGDVSTVDKGLATGVAVEADPIREPSGEGLDPVWLYGDIQMRVWPEDRERFPIEFLQGGKRLLLMETRGEPWLNKRLQDRIPAALGRELGDIARKPDFTREKVRTAFDEIRKTIEENPSVKGALTSRPVRLVLSKTKSVDVFPSREPRGTLFEVLLDDQTLELTAAQMAGQDARILNVAWMSLFFEPLNASKRDWLRIQKFWTDPELRVIQETEVTTEAEAVIERLRADLEGVTLVATRRELVGDTVGLLDKEMGRVWVGNSRISLFWTRISSDHSDMRPPSRSCCGRPRSCRSREKDGAGWGSPPIPSRSGASIAHSHGAPRSWRPCHHQASMRSGTRSRGIPGDLPLFHAREGEIPVRILAPPHSPPYSRYTWNNRSIRASSTRNPEIIPVSCDACSADTRYNPANNARASPRAPRQMPRSPHHQRVRPRRSIVNTRSRGP